MIGIARSVATAALLLSFTTTQTAGAAEIPGLTGSWRATEFTVLHSDAGALEMISLGAAMWFTIEPGDRYVLTLKDPEQAVPRAEVGGWRVVSGALLEIQPDGSSEVVPLTVVVTGDTLLLEGPIEVDLNQDGVDELARFRAVLARDDDKTAEGDGIAGAWVRSDGRVRTYRLHVPEGADGEPASLVLVFHGSGDTGDGIRGFSGMDRAADQHGTIVAYPDGVGGQWAAGCECTEADLQDIDDLLFTDTLIAQLAAAYPIDRDRVYAAGFSQGSMFTQRLGCELSHRIAAIAGVAGGMPSRLAATCQPGRPVPTLLFHGTDDGSARFESTSTLLGARDTLDKWAASNACAAKVVEPLADLVADGTTVTREAYASCDAGAEAILYAIQSGGHTWPGSTTSWPASFGLVTHDISASELVAEFFASHSLH